MSGLPFLNESFDTVRQSEEVPHQLEVLVEDLVWYAVIGNVEEPHPVTKLNRWVESLVFRHSEREYVDIVQSGVDDDVVVVFIPATVSINHHCEQLRQLSPGKFNLFPPTHPSVPGVRNTSH